MGTLVLIVIFATYFMPSLVAVLRGHRNAGAIIALNLFLGWTFIGWVASLVWSLTNPAQVVAAGYEPKPNYPEYVIGSVTKKDLKHLAIIVGFFVLAVLVSRSLSIDSAIEQFSTTSSIVDSTPLPKSMSCDDLIQGDHDDKYFTRMDKLSKMAGINGWSRYTEDFVYNVCTGDISAAKQTVAGGYLTPSGAIKIAQILGVPYQ